MPGPPPINVSINSLVSLLQTRLGDSGTFWNAAELALYVRQAIREFQVLTNYWRARVDLTTTALSAFYDLHATGAIPYTVEDTDILNQVGYHLLEYDGSQTAPINTLQFSINALSAALDQRREEILGESRLVVTEYAGNAPGPPPPSGTIQLSSGVIQIHRVEWLDLSGSTALTWAQLVEQWQNLNIPWDQLVSGVVWSLVSRTDEIGGYGWSYGWAQTPGAVPTGYSVAAARPFVVQFIPGPTNTGYASILITACNPYTYTPGTPQLLGIPDDAAFALPWGIMASMLSQDAQSRDYRRATYAQQRFRQALEVLKTWPCVMNTYPGGIQYPPSTLFALDHWQAGWRNQAPALPAVVAVAGRNLVACSPVPDQQYLIAMDCVVNSPASGVASANFSMAGDIVTAILDNAYHLAAFKLQGEEWEATMPLYQEFLTCAKENADRERAQSINWEALLGVTAEETAEVPYEAEKVEA